MLNKKLIFVLIIASWLFVLNVFGGDEFNPNNKNAGLYFRDLRVDAWTMLIGDDKGILSVVDKLGKMYGGNALKVKVDMANLEFSEGNWHYEFSKLAEKSISENNYLAAAGYYTIASYPEYANDKRAYLMYDKALGCFQQYLKNKSIPYKILKVNVDGVEMEAYLVYPKAYKPGDKVPVLLETGGIDGQMVINFSTHLNFCNKENFAWVGCDQFRLGTARNVPMTGQVDSIFVEVIKKLQEDKGIDKNNIFVYGRSLGGCAATRLVASGHANELNIAGVIADPPMGEFMSDKNLWNTCSYLDPNLKHIWAARIDADPNNLCEIYNKTKSLRFPFSKENFWGNHETSVPLLVRDTAFDPVCPVEHIIRAAQVSKKGEIFIENAHGHCTSRTGLGEANLIEFIKRNMRQK